MLISKLDPETVPALGVWHAALVRPNYDVEAYGSGNCVFELAVDDDGLPGDELQSDIVKLGAAAGHGNPQRIKDALREFADETCHFGLGPRAPVELQFVVLLGEFQQDRVAILDSGHDGLVVFLLEREAGAVFELAEDGATICQLGLAAVRSPKEFQMGRSSRTLPSS